jgi:hypothetical protein
MSPIIEKVVTELETRRFFGTVEIKFEAGRVVLIRKSETLKPNDYRSTRGERDGNQ